MAERAYKIGRSKKETARRKNAEPFDRVQVCGTGTGRRFRRRFYPHSISHTTATRASSAWFVSDVRGQSLVPVRRVAGIGAGRSSLGDVAADADATTDDRTLYGRGRVRNTGQALLGTKYIPITIQGSWNLPAGVDLREE